jgi:hypothetical protein
MCRVAVSMRLLRDRQPKAIGGPGIYAIKCKSFPFLVRESTVSLIEMKGKFKGHWKENTAHKQ